MDTTQATRPHGESQSPLVDRAADIRRRLNSIGDPCSVASGTPMGIEELGLIKSVDIDDLGVVTIAMRLTAPLCHNVGYFNVEIEERLLELDHVTAVVVTMDHGLEWTPADISPDAQRRRTENLRRLGLTRQA
jgi:metal-sulfur cluster biosynthetic enzyme